MLPKKIPYKASLTTSHSGILKRTVTVLLMCGFVSACEPSSVTDGDGKTRYISSRTSDLSTFLALPRNEPIDMLNMLRFKEFAEYEEGSEFSNKGWTGAQAYAEYSRRSQAVIDRLGAKITYAGNPAMTVIGPEDEQWDAVFVLRYESVSAFGDLMRDPEYEKHKFHRKAAVADSRLIRLAPAPLTMPIPE